MLLAKSFKALTLMNNKQQPNYPSFNQMKRKGEVLAIFGLADLQALQLDFHSLDAIAQKFQSP